MCLISASARLASDAGQDFGVFRRPSQCYCQRVARRFSTAVASCLLLSCWLLSSLIACQSDAKPRAEGPGSRAAGAPSEAREVELEQVVLSTLEQTIDISGTLAADEQVTVATKVAGRLASIDVDLASWVKQGQVIAQIDKIDYKFGVQQADAALGQARAQLGLPPEGSRGFDVEATAIIRQARATLEEARVSATRLQALVDEGLTPQAELDRARATLARADAALQAAREEVRLREAQVRQRESQLEIARQQLKETAIVSPLDGYVQARRASAGEYLAAGAPVVEVVRIDPLRLRLALPEREASQVRRGQAVRVMAEGVSGPDGGAHHTGVVARLAPSLDAQSRSLLIEADIPNPGGLRPGNFVQARIVLGTRQMPTVSRGSLVTFAGLQKVIMVKDGAAVERPVTAGGAHGDQVEILSGLAPGDRVVREPGSLAQGQPVRVRSAPAGGER